MPDQPPPKTTRRSLLRLAGFGAVVAAAYGGTALLRRLTEPGLQFEPVAGVPGFRRIAGGPISGGATAFVGIGSSSDEGSTAQTISDGALCGALFDPGDDQPRDPAHVQIAYFTDYRCFYCRQVSPMLAQMAQGGGVQVTWHDLPLLGQISSVAARAAVAARAQGAYDAFHERLMGTPVVPTPPYLRQLSEEVGIDPARLLRDMTARKTERQLQRTAALARRFGFIGTPALVVGRTAVLGGVDRRMVERLVRAERAMTDPGPCSG
ncbi:DsbA family protein [uncultured Roseovarius sp.]|uniref:DsbA family protein n=1 Tax=uncultured Roseovarius sp. TaxID=293344 RepID=UPI00261871C0|nr:DsbA family protein [uncultured Roseovarius sp.]